MPVSFVVFGIATTPVQEGLVFGPPEAIARVKHVMAHDE